MRKKAAVAAAFLILATVAVVSSTGYLNLFREVDDTTRFVPAEADVAVHVNTTAVADNRTTDRLFREATGVGYDQALAAVQNRTNLNPGGLREATVFYDRDGSSNVAGTYAGVVFRTDWNADDMRDVDGFDLEERSYNGVPLYVVRSNVTEETRPFYVAPVARGVYVAGASAAVRDASDAAFWNADGFDPDARDELGDAPVTFAAPNASLLNGVSYVSGTYRPRADHAAVTVELQPSEDADVADVRREVGTYFAVGETLGNGRLATVLSRVELRKTDTSVVASHKASVEDTGETFRILDARFGWRDSIQNRLEAYGAFELLNTSSSDTDRKNSSS